MARKQKNQLDTERCRFLTGIGMMLILCSASLGGDRTAHSVTIRMGCVNHMEIQNSLQNVLKDDGAGLPDKGAMVLCWHFDSPFNKVSMIRLPDKRLSAIPSENGLHNYYTLENKDIAATEFMLDGKCPMQDLLPDSATRQNGHRLIITLTDID